MHLFALTPTQLAGGQIALAAALALAGFYLLLPRPRGRWIAGGIALSVAALAVFAVFLHSTFGNPMPDLLGSILFGTFSLGALGFGSVLVLQRNPARGALAFAFVILSTCGLFLLLAAPFLMAATVIIYAGAIIVTFLFVLMLSQPQGESNENDRTREPLLGSLAGFAFIGLVLLSLYVNAASKNQTAHSEGDKATLNQDRRLPNVILTNEERKELAEAVAKLDTGDEMLGGSHSPASTNEVLDYFQGIKTAISEIVGVSSQEEEGTRIREGSIRIRLEIYSGKPGAGAVLYREDQQSRAVLMRAAKIRALNWDAYKQLELCLLDKKVDPETARNRLRSLRDEVLLLYGAAELPADNVENLGFMLYSDHLLAIELAGTLLLVASIGAVAIAQRKGVPA